MSVTESAAEHEHLSIFITLATTALQLRRPDAPAESKKHADDTLSILQHVNTLLTTGTPGNVKGPANDADASRVVAVTANV